MTAQCSVELAFLALKTVIVAFSRRYRARNSA